MQKRVWFYRDGKTITLYRETYFLVDGTPVSPMYCSGCKRYVYVPMAGGKVLCPLCGHFSPWYASGEHEFANKPDVLLEYLPVPMQKCNRCGGDCIDSLDVRYGADPRLPQRLDGGCSACSL